MERRLAVVRQKQYAAGEAQPLAAAREPWPRDDLGGEGLGVGRPFLDFDVGVDENREQDVDQDEEDDHDEEGDDDDVKFVEEEVIPSVTFLLQKASETEDVEKQKQYLGKLGDGSARCGEHLYLEAAKAYRDLDDLMLKENDASLVGGAAAA